MEEEKKINEDAAASESIEQQETSSIGEEALQNGTAVNDEAIRDGADALGDDTAQESEELPQEQPEQPLTFGFGDANAVLPIEQKEKKEKRNGPLAFFAMFGAVVGACMLLLFLTLWLGDGGFEIIRNLRTERVVYVREDDGTSGLLTPSEAAQKVAASAVTVLVETAQGGGIGSGFVYTADGYIITNCHVVQQAVKVQVLLPTGMAYDATVKGYNADADVAVLKIEAPGLVPAEIGSSADLLVGEDVLAIGTPASLIYEGTVTFGKVSATNRLLPLVDESGAVVKKMTLIQTDAASNPGNSGGPLADMYGRVVGIIVMRLAIYEGNTYDGLGFALPIDGVKQIADAIIAHGSFDGDNPITEGRSLLGLTGHGGVKGMWYSNEPNPLTGAMEASETEKDGYHFMKEDGVYVTAVSGGDALSGKVQAGDIIQKINGMPVQTIYDLISEANRHYAGETVTLTILRGSETTEVSVRLYEDRAQ